MFNFTKKIAKFAKWKGLAEIFEVKARYSYIAEYNGERYHLHAIKLCKFHVQAEEAACNNAAYVTDVCNYAEINETDVDFGETNPLSGETDLPRYDHLKGMVVSQTAETRDDFVLIYGTRIANRKTHKIANMNYQFLCM